MEAEAARPPACLRCGTPMKEIGRAPHPTYINLTNIEYCCDACGYDVVAAVALIDGPDDEKRGKD